MQYLEIILNLPVNQGFTYSYIPPEKEKAVRTQPFQSVNKPLYEKCL